MKKDLLKQAETMDVRRKQRKGWKSLVRMMVLCVVFCTTYMLILPAITTQGEPVCGFPEHIHTEQCYQQPQAQLSGCGLPDGALVVHRHQQICYNEDGTLICTLPEQAAHTHDDTCLTTEPVLSCSVTHAHSSECITTERVLTCQLPESGGHTHSEDCTGTRTVQVCTAGVHEHEEQCWQDGSLICTSEVHSHGEGCFTQETVSCTLPESAGHTHDDSCYTVTEIPCTEPTAEDHIHDEGCWQQTTALTCGLEELALHVHGEGCTEGAESCTQPFVIEHTHTESCLVMPQNPEPVLICGMQEHIHVTECYPLEEQPVGPEHLCGYAAHTHNEDCRDESGALCCTIPEHQHEAACILADLDLDADTQWRDAWNTKRAGLEFTGVWAEDLLLVASSQLGTTESSRNCVLKDDVLMGYTCYGDWYGDPYGSWDDMFVSFCLYYADIPSDAVPYGSDTVKWIEKLTEQGLYAGAETCEPEPGDLIFWDSDGDGTADKSGILTEITGERKLRVITGDTENNRVETVSIADDDSRLTGFGRLPENPMSPEQWDGAETVNELLAALPDAQTLGNVLRSLNDSGDRAAYEALRQEAVSRMEEAEEAYNALNDEQKARITGLERLEELKELCGGESWQQFPALTDDGAALIQLSLGDTEILTEAPERAESEIPDRSVLNGESVRYTLTADAQSYYSDIRYGEALVKVELVLPLTRDKAVFDLDAMPWLEDSRLTTETRIINETETVCQVLTGYKRLTADETNGIVIPGSFTETFTVKVLDMAHGEKLAVIVSAALSHNTWDGVCEQHQQEEKLTAITDSIRAHVPQEAALQQTNYQTLLAEAEQIAAAELSDSDQYFTALELLQRVADCYNAGGLTDDHLAELSAMLTALTQVNLSTIAEPNVGSNWMKIDFEETVVYGPQSVTLSRYSQKLSLKTVAALSAETYSEAFPSSQQIREEGGENVSSDNQVYVSKTIEGTDTENVFDITLQIVTQDQVNEIYKDPDMAVVVVMDISNTMRSDFGDVTRYEAAMTAGANFLQKFAEQNSTLSRVGYVAFNTHAHEIFDLSPCNTTAQAASLTSTMKSKTGTIINASGYSSSWKRFTNMEAGLKMAYDMLAESNNQHKYIIFISDGFPTTYLKSGYNGYDPNCSSGTKDTDGVFYDDALNKYCLYGTSYSDTAAIKARKLAVTLKEDGVNIFSIGVDVGGQTLSRYHAQSVSASNFSTVERRNEASWYRSNGYEIGIDHDILWESGVPSEDNYNSNPGKYPEWTAQIETEAGYFKNWLKGSATTGIGSGYYYDSTDLSGLNAAYESIFQKILELNASSAHLDWVASDPMPDMGVTEVKAMEFIGFWDLNDDDEWVLVADDLTGVCSDGNLYDNTADFHEDTQTIHWDIKQSGYVSKTIDNTTTYLVELKYRVRLRNEESVFVERESYDTNDVTTLTYRVIEVDDTETYISERRTVEFPIPAVEGYLAELSFDKVDTFGEPVDGAEFTLSHDIANCGYCRGDGAGYVTVADMVALSDADGKVTFTRIPSGHTYILTETGVPEGYKENGNTYQVTVAYDALTVTVTDQDGNPLTWEALIENLTSYRLPDTGGIGTQPFTFGGLLILAAACVYVIQFGRKRQKGGARTRKR